ncbi:discoidin domain-containing protein [Viridibacillus sp. YIM B01967]|uniref:Discoidin domain-containing protein n=1 Tax=Viridibacillus soli TaxID=2798301 RepID=A0ABS1H7A8_9BACL|nr:discoidin domain-containing protein [Viridibacillus soli]MBK3495308.1 discoidin domain-containing protein [Viridibacillus soli]
MTKLALPNIKDFSKVWYVSPYGNDVTGNGSKDNPYASHRKAMQEAASGDGVFIQSGTYQSLHFDLDNYGTICFYDISKKLTVWGENEKTIINFYGSEGVKRDACIFAIYNSESTISNMKINYYPGKSTNYSNSIFRLCNGYFQNLFIENLSTQNWSTCYYNNQTTKGPKVTNCIIKSNGRYTSNYSGHGQWDNCLFDYPHGGGTATNHLQRSIMLNDSVLEYLPIDLVDKGNVTIIDPNKSRSNIGVCGGPYGWGFILNKNKYLFRDGKKIKKYIVDYYENVSINGKPLTNGGISINAFDDKASTYWKSQEHGEAVLGKSYIGYDLGSIMNISKVSITQTIMDYDKYIGISSIILQCSDDGVNWVSIKTLSLQNTTSAQEFILMNNNPSRFWRLLANANPKELFGGNYYYWNVSDIKFFVLIKGVWSVVGYIPATKEMFDVHGMDDLTSITNKSIQQLASNMLELLNWTDGENLLKKLIVDAIPHNQLVLPTKDINIRSIENIDSIILKTAVSGNALVKVIVSFDKGITWQAHNNVEWIKVNETTWDVLSSGMDPIQLEAVTYKQWAELRGNSNTIRFAYALSKEDTTDVGEIDSLITQMDMKGTWKKAVHDKDYSYEYPNNDELLVTIYANGDYKINY